ncbi:MAG: helix-turn-helix transcriptional regulator [Abitibacteriaceae bacterium]|nr:helix-turn-helix transcriptional regulator [Abditibacteriaceae bacterium]
MSRITIEQLGVELKRKRGERGLRETAKEIGISTATLSRIESGKQPDLDTFSKLCKWLGVDAGELLGCSLEISQEMGVVAPNQAQPTINQSQKAAPLLSGSVYAHFRADKELSAETAQHLSALILAVQEFLISEGQVMGGETDRNLPA